MPQKKPFITLAQAKEIAADIPTPFHLYDEKGIRENARAVYARLLDAESAVHGCAVEQVSVKATTGEGLGFTGSKQGIAAHCVCLLERI